MNGGSARISIATCLLATVVTLTGARTASADSILRDGVGAISASRGGTNLGFADNGTIILDNPGALVNVGGTGLVELGADLLITDLSYSDPDNPNVSSANNPFPMGQLSLVRKSEDGMIAWGLGAFSQAGFSAQYDMNGPFPFPGQQRYKSIGALMRVLPSASVALTSRWSVGATLGVAVSHTELEGPYFTQYPTPFQGTPTRLDLQGTGAGLSWSVGTQYRLSPTTVLGVSYLGETHIEQTGSTVLTVPGLGSSRYDLTMETQWPSILGIGLSHQICPCRTLGIDVLWTRWSGAKVSYDMVLTNPSSPVFGAVLGPQVPERFPLEWQDSVAIRLGFQRCLGNGRIVRTGYVYHPNVIPDDTLTPFIQSILQHTVSIGYGWHVGAYEIDLGYQYMFGPSQSVGRSDFLGGDFDNSRSTAGAHFVLTNIIRRF